MEITGDHYLDDKIYETLYYFNLSRLNKEYFHIKYYSAHTFALLSHENGENGNWKPEIKNTIFKLFLNRTPF